MLVMDLGDGVDRLECRVSWQQRAISALPIALVWAGGTLFTGGSLAGALVIFILAFVCWFIGVTWGRSFTLDPAGIRTKVGITSWHEVQDIRVVIGFGNSRACRVRTYFADGRYSTERTLLFTAWWFPDPDFDHRVRLLQQSWHRHLARLPGRPAPSPPPPATTASF
jgi:hypothetical protein